MAKSDYRNYLNLRTLKLGVVSGLALLVLTGGDGNGCASDQARKKQALRAYDTPSIENYVERENLVRRQEIFDDPNTITFIYGLSDIGNVLFMDVAKGKLTSSQKRLEPTMGDSDYSLEFDSKDLQDIQTNEIMQADGTYGSSDHYVFWFTPEGIYRQWNGKYIATNVPIKLKEPVINFSDIDREAYDKARIAQNALKQGKKVTDKLEVLK